MSARCVDAMCAAAVEAGDAGGGRGSTGKGGDSIARVGARGGKGWPTAGSDRRVGEGALPPSAAGRAGVGGSDETREANSGARFSTTRPRSRPSKPGASVESASRSALAILPAEGVRAEGSRASASRTISSTARGKPRTIEEGAGNSQRSRASRAA